MGWDGIGFVISRASMVDAMFRSLFSWTALAS